MVSAIVLEKKLLKNIIYIIYARVHNCQLIGLSTYPKGKTKDLLLLLMIIYSFVGKKMYWFYLKAPAILTTPPPPPQNKCKSLNIFQKVCTESISDWCECDQPNWSCQKWYKRLEPESKTRTGSLSIAGLGWEGLNRW